jgi:iron complex transport system substrate-binding protein
MRIVSLLPPATEILYAIGAGDSVAGLTHECDFPPAAAQKPVLIRSRVDPSLPPAEADAQVRQIVERGESIYVLDDALLLQLAPDLIVAQDLCHVCAASPEDLAGVLSRVPDKRRPRVLTFTPHTLMDIRQGIIDIANAAHKPDEGAALARRFGLEAGALERQFTNLSRRPRVLCLEWFDPLFVAGHWVPEMVRLAGGVDVLGREGEPSIQISWADVQDAKPDVIMLMSCGYDLDRNLRAWQAISLPPEWHELPAVQAVKCMRLTRTAIFRAVDLVWSRG